MKRIFIVHKVHFEKWGPDTPMERGIGGSETSQCELAWRFARRGWEVTSYAPVPWTGKREWRGTTWAPLEDVDWSQPGVWLLYRRPEDLDNFSNPHPVQKLGVIAQDESFLGRWNDERVAKVDNLFALCQSHRMSLEHDHPGLAGKVLVTSNGIRPEQFRELDQNMPQREPHRIMWASSPDRGLLNVARIFKRLRHWVTDAKLVIAYGWDNIDVLCGMPQFSGYKKTKEEIKRELDQPGIEWIGRIPQKDLIYEWAKSSILCYSTTFRETSCISIMEAQAAGCIPVVSPVWALAENLVDGAIVCGDPTLPMTRCRFVGEICRLMSQPELAEQIRPHMMAEARFRFSWERQVDFLEAWMLGIDTANRMTHSQFNFQLKHAEGEILNVGCADDPADLKRLGALNMDLRTEDPIFHRKTKADIIADVRQPLPLNGHRFSTIIAGDIFEHFDPAEVPAVLVNLKQHLKPDGKIVLTVPDDHRPVSEQHSGSDGTDLYTDGVCACHDHPVPLELLVEWCRKADLKVETSQVIDYGPFTGHGIIARKRVED